MFVLHARASERLHRHFDTKNEAVTLHLEKGLPEKGNDRH